MTAIFLIITLLWWNPLKLAQDYINSATKTSQQIQEEKNLQFKQE